MWPVFTHCAHCSSNTILSQGCLKRVARETQYSGQYWFCYWIKIYIFSIFIPLFHSCEHKNRDPTLIYIKLTWAEFVSELFDRLLFNHLSVLLSVCYLSHFYLILKKQSTNFNQTWHKASFCEGDSSLFKRMATPYFKGR